MVNVQDIQRLRNTLEQFRFHLCQFTRNVPDLDYGFKVVKFDYAQDGVLPIPVSFAYPYYDLEKELIQIYTKRSNEFFTEVRNEKKDINPNAIFHNFEKTLLGKKNFN
jgi:hypothetical protein